MTAIPICSLQDLICYLARLARYADSCSAEGLAGVLGPVLLDPETVTLAVDADSLTLAAIWVVQTLLRCGSTPPLLADAEGLHWRKAGSLVCTVLLFARSGTSYWIKQILDEQTVVLDGC